jgi:riboflavin biosynthesis pyrimidine reductase
VGAGSPESRPRGRTSFIEAARRAQIVEAGIETIAAGRVRAGVVGPDRGGSRHHVGDLYVSGSGTLVRAMLTDGPVDVLHLCVHPHARGGGSRLFPEGVGPSDFEREAFEAFDNGVLYLAYRSKR